MLIPTPSAGSDASQIGADLGKRDRPLNTPEHAHGSTISDPSPFVLDQPARGMSNGAGGADASVKSSRKRPRATQAKRIGACARCRRLKVRRFGVVRMGIPADYPLLHRRMLGAPRRTDEMHV